MKARCRASRFARKTRPALGGPTHRRKTGSPANSAGQRNLSGRCTSLATQRARYTRQPGCRYSSSREAFASTTRRRTGRCCRPFFSGGHGIYRRQLAQLTSDVDWLDLLVSAKATPVSEGPNRRGISAQANKSRLARLLLCFSCVELTNFCDQLYHTSDGHHCELGQTSTRFESRSVHVRHPSA